MTNKFHNSDGSLTAYGLACGYIDRYDVPGNRYSVVLSAEGACYHVKVRDERLSLGLAAWEAYDTLTEARKAVRKAVRHYKGLPHAEPTERSTGYDPAPWDM